jgi:hypothetical protein
MSSTKFLFFMAIGIPRWPPPQDIFEISANQSILLALAAMLNIRLERKTEICRAPSKEHSC